MPYVKTLKKARTGGRPRPPSGKFSLHRGSLHPRLVLLGQQAGRGPSQVRAGGLCPVSPLDVPEQQHGRMSILIHHPHPSTQDWPVHHGPVCGLFLERDSDSSAVLSFAACHTKAPGSGVQLPPLHGSRRPYSEAIGFYNKLIRLCQHEGRVLAFHMPQTRFHEKLHVLVLRFGHSPLSNCDFFEAAIF